jgi:hypothetical protein
VLPLVPAIDDAAGGAEGTEPPMAAGIGIALGGFAFAVVALWAVTVPVEVAVGMDAPTAMTNHRWVTALAALVVPVASLWWSRALGLI